MDCSICIPCSTKYHACEDFPKLTSFQQFTTVLLTALACLATFGLGTVCAFRTLVGRFKRIDEVEEPLKSKVAGTASRVDDLPQTRSLSTPAEAKPTVVPKPISPLPVLKFNLETSERYEERLKGLDRITIQDPSVDILKFSHAIARDNASKNRYGNILPFDDHRIILSHTPDGNSDYINASIFESEDGEIILTQGPLARTQADFWIMAFENNCQVVCLTDHLGANSYGVISEKTFPYWQAGMQTDPPQPRVPQPGEIIYSQMTGPENNRKALIVKLTHAPVKLIESNEKSKQSITKSIFEVTLGNESRQIIHWHLEHWIDQSGACDEQKLVKLIVSVIDASKTCAAHCSAGVGRTGVFVIIKLFIERFNKTGNVPTEDEIDQAIFNLRQARLGAVQTGTQRELISKAIKYYIENYSASR